MAAVENKVRLKSMAYDVARRLVASLTAKALEGWREQAQRQRRVYSTLRKIASRMSNVVLSAAVARWAEMVAEVALPPAPPTPVSHAMRSADTSCAAAYLTKVV